MMKLPQSLGAVNWTFGYPFTSISFELSIPDCPRNIDGTLSPKGIYFQLYDGTINGVGMYFGLQTNMIKPRVGPVGFGMIFSRWETGDENLLRVPDGGFHENSAHEGQFIGVRMPLNFHPGKYLISLTPGAIDIDGVWYNLSVADAIGKVDCGGLKFPLVGDQNIGFADGCGTWAEIYRTEEKSGMVEEKDVPKWQVEIRQVSANDELGPQHTRITYPYNGELPLSNISQMDLIVKFDLGPDVERIA